jgi:type IV secretory pathway VirB10-like protein
MSMSQDNDYLSPDTSPSKLQTAGVKRVNNMPLIIAIGVFSLFVVLIAFVAQKRAHAQNVVPENVTQQAPKKNTMNLAYEVVGHRNVEQTGELNPEEPKVQAPLPEAENINNLGVTDDELERIRQEKTQAFEEALKAKTSIMIENPRVNHEPSAESEPTEHLQQALGGDENVTRWHLNSNLENPNSRYELRTGNVIPGVMISGISSEFPGQIIGQVSQNVFDTATGKYLLIPQGTKLIGVYSNDVSFGQSSILIAWQRLVFPDGKALDIGSMPGSDSAGLTGFRDKVNHHYAQVYGSALLMSGIVAGMSYSQNIRQPNPYGYNQPTAGSVLSQALGQQMGEVASQMISKNLNVSPTVHIRPGYRFNVIVVKDLTFKQPYRPFSYA